MYSVKTAAERLSLCPSVVYDLVASGVLPRYRIGKKGCRGAIRIEKADLDAFLAAPRSAENGADGIRSAGSETQDRAEARQVEELIGKHLLEMFRITVEVLIHAGQHGAILMAEQFRDG